MTDIATSPRPGRTADPQTPPSRLDDLIRVFHMHEDIYDQLAPGDRRYWLILRLMRLQEVLGYSPYVGELVESLTEVERGILTPLFEVIPNGRPKMKLTEQEIQSRAALAMEGLMLGGMKKDRAAREVARALDMAATIRVAGGRWHNGVTTWHALLAGRETIPRNTGCLPACMSRSERLRHAIKRDRQDPRDLATKELKRLGWLRRALD